MTILFMEGEPKTLMILSRGNKTYSIVQTSNPITIGDDALMISQDNYNYITFTNNSDRNIAGCYFDFAIP